MGYPQRWLPKTVLNMYNGFVFPALVRNIKLVSNIKFAKYAGIANHTSNNKHLGICLGSGFIVPPTVSISGYRASSICTEKLCMCIKLVRGSFVQVGKSNAAKDVVIHTA